MLGADGVVDGRHDGGLGIAGGAPGVNAVLESSLTWAVAVLGNLDPPSAGRLASPFIDSSRVDRFRVSGHNRPTCAHASSSSKTMAWWRRR